MFAYRFASALQHTLAGRALAEGGAGLPASFTPGGACIPLEGTPLSHPMPPACGDEGLDLAQRVRETGEW